MRRIVGILLLAAVALTSGCAIETSRLRAERQAAGSR